MLQVEPHDTRAIDDAFDDAYRSERIEAGDDPSQLPDPYARGPGSSVAGRKRKRADGGAGKETREMGETQQGGSLGGCDSDMGGGGFIADDNAEGGGGFIPEDNDGGGGFIPDNDGPSGGGLLPDDSAGGFLPDAEAGPSSRDGSPTTSVSAPTYLALSAIPHALANLGLPTNDEHVNSLFLSVARDPPGTSRRRAGPNAPPVEKVVARDEFTQVARVLLESAAERDQLSLPHAADQPDDGEDAKLPEASRRRRRPQRSAAIRSRGSLAEAVAEGDSGDSADEFQGAAELDGGSDLSDLDNEDDYGSTSRSGRGAKGTPKSQAKSKGRNTNTGKTQSKSSPSKSASGGLRRARTRQTTGGTSSVTSEHSDLEGDRGEEELTDAQLDEVQNAFALFTDMAARRAGNKMGEVDVERLRLADLKRVAEAVGEKLSEDEVSAKKANSGKRSVLAPPPMHSCSPTSPLSPPPPAHRNASRRLPLLRARLRTRSHKRSSPSSRARSRWSRERSCTGVGEGNGCWCGCRWVCSGTEPGSGSGTECRIGRVCGYHGQG